MDKKLVNLVFLAYNSDFHMPYVDNKYSNIS